jgi:DnaJ-class molecular chaperone
MSFLLGVTKSLKAYTRVKTLSYPYLRLPLPRQVRYHSAGKNEDLYDILQVAPTASSRTIKMAYFRMAKMYHPDLYPDWEEAKKLFQEVAEAYDVLSDESSRAAYDSTGSTSSGRICRTSEDIYRAVEKEWASSNEAFESNH